jgi:hypothetical protein
MRILTQEVMFRSGMVTAVAAEREIGSAKDEKKEEKKEIKPPPASKPTKNPSTATDGTALSKGTVPPKKTPSSGAKANGNGKASNGKASNGKASSGGDEPPDPKAHPRSRSKRTRKAR